MATTLSRTMQKATSSTIFPLANITTHRKYTSAIFTTIPLKTSTTISTSKSTIKLFGEVPSHHRFSALAKKRYDSADAHLSVIESVIDDAEEKLHRFANLPREFPFKIEDDAGDERRITLTREYQGEEIKVKVIQPYYESESDMYVYLTGSVSNKSGLTLKFNLTADAKVDAEVAIKIHCMDVMNRNDSEKDKYYWGTELSGLDEKLQKAFRTYLEVRGIEPSITKILYDRIEMNKQKKHIALMKNYKSFIANSDDNFLRVVESVMNRAKQEFHEVMPEAPKEFPFKIEDNIGERTITLTREYQGEVIIVTVEKVEYASGSSSDDEEKEEDGQENKETDHSDSSSGDKENESYPPCVLLDINISRKNGLTLKFRVFADDADEFTINSLAVNNPNASDDYIAYKLPAFSGNLHKALRAYLEIRGFGPRNIKFLNNYMVNRNLQKEHKKHITWLNNLKNFIAN